MDGSTVTNALRNFEMGFCAIPLEFASKVRPHAISRNVYQRLLPDMTGLHFWFAISVHGSSTVRFVEEVA
jgi:hypothetical protein